MRMSVCAAILALMLTSAGPLHAQSASKRVKEGNTLYSEKKYDRALNKYQDALLSRPEDGRIQFNVANTLYQKKKFEEALEAYRKVVGTEELPLEAQTYFNMGNTLFRMGKLPESILAYQQALKLDPEDLDAKYNLEYVRRKLKQNAQKQPGDSQQESSGDQQPQPQPQPDEEQESEDERQPGDPQAGEQGDEQEPPADPETGEQKPMTKAEAERVLNALKNDEKDIQKKRKMKASGKVRIKKDW